jgi:hypothetical protein
LRDISKPPDKPVLFQVERYNKTWQHFSGLFTKLLVGRALFRC